MEDGNFIPRRRTGSSSAAITTGDTVFLSSTDRDLLSDVDYACARTPVYTSTRAAHHKPHVSAQCIIKKEASRLSPTVTNISQRVHRYIHVTIHSTGYITHKYRVPSSGLREAKESWRL